MERLVFAMGRETHLVYMFSLFLTSTGQEEAWFHGPFANCLSLGNSHVLMDLEKPSVSWPMFQTRESQTEEALRFQKVLLRFHFVPLLQAA